MKSHSTDNLPQAMLHGAGRHIRLTGASERCSQLLLILWHEPAVPRGLPGADAAVLLERREDARRCCADARPQARQGLRGAAQVHRQRTTRA